MVLAMEAAAPEAAVQAAMGKGMVVTRVTRRARSGIAMVLAGVCCAAILLGAGCAILYWRHRTVRSELLEAMAENGRLAGALADTGEIVTRLEHRTQVLEQAQGGAARSLVDQLDAARAQLAVSEKELTVARGRMDGLEKIASGAGRARQDLATVQARAADLEGQLQTQRRRVQELETSSAAAEKIKSANRDLAAQVDLLKSQLLEQAAKSDAVPMLAQPVEPAIVPERHPRWAIGTSYDATSDFIALHFDKDAAATVPGNEGVAITTSALTANAATIRVVHDTQRQRVYAVTLSLSFAADAPKKKLAENQQLVADFVRAFAPGFTAPDGWLSGAVRALTDKGAGERMIRIGEDFKLTVWNNGGGVYLWKIESPREDQED
jgi:hypothetical protein